MTSIKSTGDKKQWEHGGRAYTAVTLRRMR